MVRVKFLLQIHGVIFANANGNLNGIPDFNSIAKLNGLRVQSHGQKAAECTSDQSSAGNVPQIA